MNLIKLFANSENEDISLIFHCLLNRVPIIIINSQEYIIEEFLNSLSSLMSFRNPMIYYNDFIQKDDYISLLENEEFDYGVQRNIFLCYPYSTEKAIKSFDSFKSWIIGCIKGGKYEKIFYNLHKKLFSNEEFFLIIKIKSDCLKTKLEGKTFPDINLSFEKWLFQNAIKNTEIAIEKMKRVISKRIKKKKIEKDFYKNIMNFSFEENEIKENIIKKEIQNFFEASKRTFNLLNRMKNLEQFGFKTQIASRTIFEAISYKNSSIERILSFIDKEWGCSFNSLLNKKKSSNFTDTFESLWG